MPGNSGGMEINSIYQKLVIREGCFLMNGCASVCSRPFGFSPTFTKVKVATHQLSVSMSPVAPMSKVAPTLRHKSGVTHILPNRSDLQLEGGDVSLHR